MSKRQVIAKIISISMQGEVQHFQMKIPENAEFITGIETGIRAKQVGEMKDGKNPPNEKKERNGEKIPAGWNPFSEELLAGELKLQSCEEANVFYAKELKVRNEDGGSVNKTNFFQENTWTHGLKRELDEVTVDGDTTIISGIYRDKVGEFFKRDIQYDVTVYLWYEINEKLISTNMTKGDSEKVG